MWIFIILLLILLITRTSRRSYYNKGSVKLTWTNEKGTTDIVEKWVLTVDADGQNFKKENTVDVRDGDVVNMEISDLPYAGQYNYNLSYKRFDTTQLFNVQEGTVAQNEKLLLTSSVIQSQPTNYDVDCVATYTDDTCPPAPASNEENCGTKAKTTRRWTIMQPSQGNGQACPPPTEMVSCGDINPCGTCEEKEWGDWSSCDVLSGTKTRSRSPTTETYGGCMNDSSKFAITDSMPCDIDCVGRWDCGPCQVAPGKAADDGSQLQKTCTWVTTQSRKNNGLACPSTMSYAVASSTKDLPLPDGATESVAACPAPVDCAGSETTGPCGSAKCGKTRYKTKTFNVTKSAAYNGKACDKINGSTRKVSCGTGVCPVNCAGYWTTTTCRKKGSSNRGIQSWYVVTTNRYTRTKDAAHGGDNSCPSNGKTTTSEKKYDSLGKPNLSDC